MIKIVSFIFKTRLKTAYMANWMNNLAYFIFGIWFECKFMRYKLKTRTKEPDNAKNNKL